MGRPAITCEAHRSQQFHCHFRRVVLSGTLATAPASSFLRELCVDSPFPVRESTSFQQGGNKMARRQRAHSGTNRWIHLPTIEQHCIPGRGAVYHGRPFRLLPNPCYARWTHGPNRDDRRILHTWSVSQRRSTGITGTSPFTHHHTRARTRADTPRAQSAY